MESSQNKLVGGKLNVSIGVIQKIIKESVLEVDGVADFSNLPINWKDYLLRAKKFNTIKVELMGDTVVITVGISVYPDVKIQKVAKKVQQAVKTSIQETTGLVVSNVSVYVAELFNKNKDLVQGEDYE